MKARRLAAVTACLLAYATVVSAIDRNASCIDWLAVEGASYDQVAAIGASVWTEIGLATEHDDWAILAGLGGLRLTPDDGGSANAWMAALGVKYYLADLTSFALIGNYRDSGSTYNLDSGATLIAKQRLISADEVISPYVRLSASIQRATWRPSSTVSEQKFTEAVLTAEIGCDFMLRDDFALQFQGGRSESEDLSGDLDQFADGWIASVAMVYYYDKQD